MGEPEALAEHEGLRDGDLRDAQDHVVADLRGLPEPGAAAVHDTAAHRLEQRPRRLEVLVGAADHEGEGGVLGADDAARDGRVDAAVPGCLGERVRLLRLVDGDRRGVDEEGAGGRDGEQARLPRPIRGRRR